MNAVGLFKLFASAVLFILWAAQTISVASMLNPEDPVYNSALLVPAVERVADKYVGDCLAYAWVQAYDKKNPSNATAITTADVQGYMSACLATAKDNIKALPYVSDVKFNGLTITRSDWNAWDVKLSSIDVDFNFPLAGVGFTSNVAKTFSVAPVDHNLLVIDTGYVVVGSGRRQYRVVAWNRETGEVEVNGLWPR